MHATRARPWIAVIAAYAVILQAILPFVAISADPAFSICSAAHGSTAPDGALPTCGCAAGCGMACCATVLAEPPAVASTVAWSHAVAPDVPPYAELRLGAPRVGSHTARAPPFA
jgi:hypothetical protein